MIIDIIIAAFLIYGFIRGLMKGLFVEVASLIALVAGIYGAIHFSYFAGDYLKARVSWEENYIKLTAFALTFAAIVLGISLLGKFLTKLADFAFLGWINKIAGGAFGLLKKALILSVLFLVIEKFNHIIPIISEETREQSILYKPVSGVLPGIFPDFTKKVMKGNFSSKNQDNKQEE